MSLTCLYRYHCYPHVLHDDELPDKDVLTEAVTEHEANRNNISSTSACRTGGAAPSEVTAIEGDNTQAL